MRQRPSIVCWAWKFSILSLILWVAFPTSGFPQTLLTNSNGNSQESDQSSGGADAESLSRANPQLKSIIEQISAAGVLHPESLNAVKRAYIFYTNFEGPREHIFRVTDLTIPTPTGTIRARLYIPNENGNLPIFVFFHGGGFVSGNLDTHDAPLRAVANRCNCLVVSVAYRLAPENPFPAAPDDCYAATKWVADHASDIGGDPRRIAVGGDGAGGNLAAVVALMARDRGGPHLSYQVLLYPILDATTSTNSWNESTDPVLTSDAMLTKWSAYVPLTANFTNPYISPAEAESLKELPPALILTGANDPAWDGTKGFARDLDAAGVPVELFRYQNTIHGFFLMSGELDAGIESINQVASALRQSFQNPK